MYLSSNVLCDIDNFNHQLRQKMVVLTDQTNLQVISNHIKTLGNSEDYWIYMIETSTDTEIQQHLIYLKSFDMKIYFVYCSLL